MIVQTGMGNLFTRSLVATRYALLGSTERAVMEFTVRGMVAEARWLQQAEGAVDSWANQAPNDPRVSEARVTLSDMRGTLRNLDRIVRDAVQAAKDDGHNINVSENQATLGLPILIVLIVVGAVVVIACQYIASDQERKADYERNQQYWVGAKDTVSRLIAAGRADLVPSVVTANAPGTRSSSQSGVSGWLVAGLGALVVAGAVGVAYATGGRR